MDKYLKGVGVAVLAAVWIVFFSVIWAYPTKWFVNYLFSPDALYKVFGVFQFTFWRALALNWLCGFLIKGSTSVSGS